MNSQTFITIALKRLSMNSETLSFRTIINELDLTLDNAKEHYQSFVKKEKHKISKAIREKYLSTKTFWKPKHF